MNLLNFLVDVKEHIAQSGIPDGFQLSGVRNMGLMQTRHAKSNTCAVIDPLIGLVLQGQKTAQYGSRRIEYAAGDVLIVGQTLPTISSVVNATPDVPFIAAYVSIDMQIVRNLYSDIDGGRGQDNTAPAFLAGTAEDELIDAMARLFRLRRDPVEEQALGDAALREVYFRVLRSKHGRALQQMIHLDSKANQIAKAIAHIRKEYRGTIKASDLASIAGMSASIFYENFKQITANSPLQYQKDLRLHDAQQMLQQAQAPISQIALAVGYESPAQFSREFSRKFGASPKNFVGAQAS
ncbi:MAG: AraC-like DNA-binding protein [Paracoccaceae bacterium]|jgi:AraC-like DNA-binding protein